VLLAVLFGPWAAYLVMTAVIIAQALLFADGGLTALGANVLNIGGAGALFGYAVYRLLTTLIGQSPWARSAAAAAAAYLATVLTGVLAGIELGLSGVAPTAVSLAAMASVYAIIGALEAAITGCVVYAIARRKPGLLFGLPSGVYGGPTNAAALAGLGIVAIAGGLLSLVASATPDALERVALDLGFADAASTWGGAPFAGYRALLPGAAGTFVAAVIGISLLFAGVVAVGRAAGSLARSRRAEAD
jgi:cobalt/nickel transport system permease protein